MFSANAKTYTVFIILCMPFLCWCVSDRWNWDICAILFLTFSMLNHLMRVCPGVCIGLTQFLWLPVVRLVVTSSFTSLVPLAGRFCLSVAFRWSFWKWPVKGYMSLSHHLPTRARTHTDIHIELLEQSPKESQGCITQKVKRLRNEV